MSETYSKKYELWPAKGGKPAHHRHFKVRVGERSMNVTEVHPNYHDEEFGFSVRLDKGEVEGLRIRASTKPKTVTREVEERCSCGKTEKVKKQVKVGEDKFMHIFLHKPEMVRLAQMLEEALGTDWRAKYPNRYISPKERAALASRKVDAAEDEGSVREEKVDEEVLERIKHEGKRVHKGRRSGGIFR